MKRLFGVLAILAVLFSMAMPRPADSACCYFSAKEKDILQPAQKAFVTWDPSEGVETFTVQPRFEGNALDFGMVIPTPSQPKLNEMPKDFFKELAVFTILKRREYPKSQLLPQLQVYLSPTRAPGATGLGPVVNSVAKGPKGAKLGITLPVLSCLHRR